jgi:hypothetical protein
MELVGAKVGRVTENTEKKQERPGPIDFLEPYGSEYQRYIPYSRMDPLLAREANNCMNQTQPKRSGVKAFLVLTCTRHISFLKVLRHLATV